ncbi:MAG: hypothetical protein AB1489_10280 [Acidobacteriota bacterium]
MLPDKLPTEVVRGAQPKRYRNLPRLPSPTPCRIAVFVSGKNALARYRNIITMPTMFRATEAIFELYNVRLDMQPPLAKGFDERSLDSESQVRVPRKRPPPGRELTKEELEQYMKYVEDANTLGKLADARIAGEEGTRLRVVLCEFDYTAEELDRAERRSKGFFVKGEALGDPSWKNPADRPIVLINLNAPSFYLADYRLILAHEIVHAAGEPHNKAQREKNLMNETPESYRLDRKQLETLANAPFCKPLRER